MAKNDNLHDFLVDVADAIREKKGTTDLINPQNFADEILSIEGGGDAPFVERKDVNFYDYDGTLLYSYTLEEAQNLTELPPLPTQEGLICQGWNWDYEDVVALDFPMDIGATYITDDGKTRFVIELDGTLGMDFLLSAQLEAKAEATIDWGDGSPTESFVGYKWDILRTHTYPSKGTYTISIALSGSGRASFWRDGAINYTTSFIKAIHWGNPEYILNPNAATSFIRLFNLQRITIPIGFSQTSSLFYYPHSLPFVVYPKGCTAISQPRAYAMHGVSIPKSCTSVYLGSNMALTSLPFSAVMENITNNFINSCASFLYLLFSENLATIGTYAFAYPNEPRVYDFSRCQQVPTLAATSAFASIVSGTKIVVPDALYDEWIASTNWATYADYIVKSSEYNA